MDIRKIRELLVGLKAGTLTKEEEVWILHFLESATEEEMSAVFPEEEWKEQQPMLVGSHELDRVYESIVPQISEEPATRIAWWKKPVIRITAAAATVLGMGVAVWQLANPGYQQYNNNATAGIEWKLITTQAGENLIIYLPDNSKIFVNGATKVMYPEKFDGPIRQIKLVEGEIFVDVAKNEQAPFKVTTGQVNINVLGTSFNVRNYKVEGLTEVAVKSGKIAVSNSGNPDSVLLTPGKRIVISETSGNSLLTETDLRSIDGWTQNEFVFNNVTLGDVFRNLEYKYGLRFEVADTKILNKHIRATFRDKSRWEILDLLSKMLHFKYQVKDSLVVIR